MISPRAAPPLRVAIVGAGVIGLALGWRLARAGLEVDIFERDRAGAGASWAAAGMLAGTFEAEETPGSLAALLLAGRERWASFAADVEAASGHSIGYRSEGTLVVAFDEEAGAALRARGERMHRTAPELQWLDQPALRMREPALAPDAVGALFSPCDRQVDNRLLGLALAQAARAAGARLHEGQAVTGLVSSRGRVAGILDAAARPREADVVVLAAGAWSAALGRDADLVPVKPMKGQILALGGVPGAPWLSHVTRVPGAYLVPRAGGKLIVGATVEDVGFDAHLTAAGIGGLLAAAMRALPASREAVILESWSGFRPGTDDLMPRLGPTSRPGLVAATGHFRNGILLAPVTADLLATYILEGRIEPLMAPFVPT